MTTDAPTYIEILGVTNQPGVLDEIEHSAQRIASYPTLLEGVKEFRRQFTMQAAIQTLDGQKFNALALVDMSIAIVQRAIEIRESNQYQH